MTAKFGIYILKMVGLSLFILLLQSQFLYAFCFMSSCAIIFIISFPFLIQVLKCLEAPNLSCRSGLTWVSITKVVISLYYYICLLVIVMMLSSVQELPYILWFYSMHLFYEIHAWCDSTAGLANGWYKALIWLVAVVWMDFGIIYEREKCIGLCSSFQNMTDIYVWNIPAPERTIHIWYDAFKDWKTCYHLGLIKYDVVLLTRVTTVLR